MFVNKKTQCCEDKSLSQPDLSIQNSPKSHKLFCGYRQTDTKGYMEGEKKKKDSAQSTSIEVKEYIWRTDILWSSD